MHNREQRNSCEVDNAREFWMHRFLTINERADNIMLRREVKVASEVQVFCYLCRDIFKARFILAGCVFQGTSMFQWTYAHTQAHNRAGSCYRVDPGGAVLL